MQLSVELNSIVAPPLTEYDFAVSTPLVAYTSLSEYV
jgi:hypothetical protein